MGNQQFPFTTAHVQYDTHAGN